MPLPWNGQFSPLQYPTQRKYTMDQFMQFWDHFHYMKRIWDIYAQMKIVGRKPLCAEPNCWTEDQLRFIVKELNRYHRTRGWPEIPWESFCDGENWKGGWGGTRYKIFWMEPERQAVDWMRHPEAWRQYCKVCKGRFPKIEPFVFPQGSMVQWSYKPPPYVEIRSTRTYLDDTLYVESRI